MEPEFNAMAPDSVSVHATRLLHLPGIPAEDVKKMAEGTEKAADLLATAGVNVIAYACTSGSLVGGIGWDQQLISRIEQATNIPATTTATAVIGACKELGVNKVALATPYHEEINQVEKEFLEAHGIKVVKIKGLGLFGEALRSTPIETAYHLAHEVNTPQAEAVFISCTGFKTITVIERLEAELKKPVFSSNTATMWDVAQRLGISSEPIKGYGQLFEH
jgi:maleate isomerase